MMWPNKLLSEKNTEGFCKTQDDDNVFSRPVTNLIWNLFQKSSIFEKKIGKSSI